MTDLLTTGRAWLEDQTKLHLEQPATYRRGEVSLSVNVKVGATGYEQGDDFGVVLDAQATDVLIAAEAIADLGAPAAGDRVELSSGAIYDALPLGGQACWRWSDASRLRYRIHVKEIA